jgi:hypothetical protein
MIRHQRLAANFVSETFEVLLIAVKFICFVLKHDTFENRIDRFSAIFVDVSKIDDFTSERKESGENFKETRANACFNVIVC